VSIDLHVTFSGLCLLVPQRDTNSLWVFMIRANGHGNVEHIPSVIYDPASTDEPVSAPPTNLRHRRLVDNLYLQLSGSSSIDVRRELRDNVPGNVSTAHQVYVPRRRDPSGVNWFNPEHAHDKVAARVVLTGVDRITAHGEKFWDYPPYGEVRLATHVTCSLVVRGMNELDVPTVPGILALYPDSHGRLDVEFHNVPADQLPGSGAPKPDELQRGQLPTHFHAYQMALGIPMNAGPRYIRPQPKRPRTSDDAAATRAGILQAAGTWDGMAPEGVNPYACLTLPGCPDDDPDCGN
jgi:hypothetical protein